MSECYGYTYKIKENKSTLSNQSVLDSLKCTSEMMNGQPKYITEDDDYSHEGMINFSKKYPDVVIQIDQYGGEDNEIAKHYYKDGKYQCCNAIITFPKYDENELL